MFPRKKIVQDIVPPGARSIRNISIDHRTAKVTVTKTPTREPVSPVTEYHVPIHTHKHQSPPIIDEVMDEPPVHKKHPKKHGGRGARGLFTFLIVTICLVVIAFGVSIFFTKGKVVVTPRTEAVEVKGTYTAKQSPASGELGYELMTVVASTSAKVASTDGALIETRAKGKVTLFNNFSTTTQKIVATTRLENSEGLIYRTDTTVTIPGTKIVAGKSTPGSIVVSVTADKPGQEYNMTPEDLTGDFKIVAYAGSSKQEKIYGRILSAISGGFLGNKKNVSKSVLDEAKKASESMLRAELIADARNVLPKDRTMYDNGYVISYSHSEPSGGDKTSAYINTEAVLTAVTFDTERFSRHIVKNDSSKFTNIPYKVDGIESLEFRIVNIKDISPKTTLPLIFGLSGDVSMVGTFSKEDLAKDIAGLSFSEANRIFARYKGIASANISVSPPWWRTLPSDSAKITIETK
jgi:hypothetical protein